jgi:adenosine deaminase
MENVLKSVNRGLERAKRLFNEQSAVREGIEPPFEYALVVCALRHFMHGQSEYYDNMLRAHAFSSAKRVFALASLELAQAAVRIRDEHGIPITGFDLAGAELATRQRPYRGLRLRPPIFYDEDSSCGGGLRPREHLQAITDLHADRIGHGTFLMDTSMISTPAVQDREAYVSDLAQYISDRRITLEICLTSNMQTNPQLRNLADHPFRTMRKARLSTTFCTDNRTVSNTSVSLEIERAMQFLDVSTDDLRRILIYGFKRSFFPGSYLDKRAYVRRIIDYYAQLAQKHPELRFKRDQQRPLTGEIPVRLHRTTSSTTRPKRVGAPTGAGRASDTAGSRGWRLLRRT